MNIIKTIKNNKGVSLVEVIVSMAILTIISVTFLNILTGSFSNTMDAGRENMDYYKAAGEMDIAIRDVSYTGEHGNVAYASETVNIFGEDIEARVIHSKTEELDSAIDPSTDPYIFTYVIDEEVGRTNEAYIDTNDNGSFDLGEDLIVTAEQLNGHYIYLGDGPLVIDDQDGLYTPMDTIDWYVKDGIKISSGITLESSSDIRIKSVDGDLSFDNLVIDSSDEVILESTLDISLIQSTILSSDNVEIRSGNAYINGIDTDRMAIRVPNNKVIDFYVSNTIYMNEYTEFYVDGSSDYAHNKSAAVLVTANTVVSDSDEFE